MNLRSPPLVKGSSGLVPLGAELGRGGEGSVFDVVGRPDLVAKIYHQAIGSEKATKIEAMASMKSDELRSVSAWPAELLTTVFGAPCGFLMPRVTGHKDIHNLYSPRSRRTEFPNADWRFLIRSAANTARAFAVVHEAGAVIGDVNHGGIAVSDKATVKLIDCDSFQIAARGTKFLCEVGVPTFTPPELQGKSFRGVVRSANHDNFGLAVLAFHLLFIGRHPFAGRYLGRGDMGLEQAITEFRFAYGHTRASVQMEPPPAVPPLEISSQPVSLLFERAFSQQGVNGLRPTARDWVSALDGLEKQTKQCTINASHHYLNTLGSCPWCHVEGATGIVLFSVFVQRTQQGGTTHFDIRAVWAAIAAVPSPGPAPQRLNRDRIGTVQPSAEARAAGGSRILRRVGVILVVLVTLFLMAAVPTGALLWLLGGFGIGAAVGGKKEDPQAVASFSSRQRTAEAQYRTILTRWENDAAESRFMTKFRELGHKRDEWNDIPQLRQRRFRMLEQEREKAQLRRFLEAFDIEDATIAGVGPGRKAMLASYNVETAWDVADANIRRVPGFGPALTSKLIDWRRTVERRFRYDQSKGVDPHDIAALDRELADAKRKLESALLNGPPDLTRLRHEIATLRVALGPQLDEALLQVVQAETDLRAVKG